MEEELKSISFKLEELLEEERQVQAIELEASKTKMKELTEEKLKLEKTARGGGRSFR